MAGDRGLENKDALPKFYENELKFTPGDTVNVYMHSGVYNFHNVSSCRVLILPGEKILVIKTETEKLIFHLWSGVSFKKRKEVEFQVG